MTDYIDKAVAMRKLVDLPAELDAVAVQRCIEAIHSVPAADVKPVLRARWVICCDGYYPYCSNCKNEPQGRVMTDFCPNCGADMRESKE